MLSANPYFNSSIYFCFKKKMLSTFKKKKSLLLMQFANTIQTSLCNNLIKKNNQSADFAIKINQNANLYLETQQSFTFFMKAVKFTILKIDLI